MKTGLTEDEKIKRWVDYNNGLVKALRKLENAGELGTREAIQTLNSYRLISEKLKDVKNIDIYIEDNKTECSVCGFPLSFFLTKHHIVPKSRFGDHTKTVMLCPTCHHIVHKCVVLGNIPDSVTDYFSSIDGANWKIEKMFSEAMECPTWNMEAV